MTGPATHKADLRLQFDPDDPEAEQAQRMAAEESTQALVQAELDRQRSQVLGAAGQGADVLQQTMPAWDKTATEALREALAQSATLGAKVSFRQLSYAGLAFDYNLANTEAVRWAQGYTYDLVRGINATTSRHLGSAVAIFANGGSLASLEDAIAPIFGADRAALIAVTETTRAYAEGTREGYRASGLVRRLEWRTSQDELVCPICGGLSGQQTEIDLDFPVPGGLGIDGYFPPAHPGCRCWIVGVVDKAQAKPKRIVKDLTEAQTVEEAQEYMAANHPGITWDFTGCHIDTIRPSMQQYEKLAADWPEVADRLEYVGTYQGANSIQPGYQWNPNHHAHASRDGKRIGLNPDWYGDPRRYQDTMEFSKSVGWHPNTRDEDLIASVLTHEWGHQVENLLLDQSPKVVWAEHVAVDGFGAVRDTARLFNLNNKPTKKLSEYAITTNKSGQREEGWAEAFAMIHHGNKSDWPVYVKRMDNLLNTAGNRSQWREFLDYDDIPWIDRVRMPDPAQREAAVAAQRKLRNMLNIR